MGPADPALREATDHKRRSTYPEFRGAARCRLVVVALEVGGRWGDETEAFLQRLARGKALASPEVQRGKVAATYARRWGQLLAVAAQGALAASLASLPPDPGDAAKNFTSRDPKQLRTDGQAQTRQQLVEFCATRMNQNDAVVNPARVALLAFFALQHVCVVLELENSNNTTL